MKPYSLFAKLIVGILIVTFILPRVAPASSIATQEKPSFQMPLSIQGDQFKIQIWLEDQNTGNPLIEEKVKFAIENTVGTVLRKGEGTTDEKGVFTTEFDVPAIGLLRVIAVAKDTFAAAEFFAVDQTPEPGRLTIYDQNAKLSSPPTISQMQIISSDERETAVINPAAYKSFQRTLKELAGLPKEEQVTIVINSVDFKAGSFVYPGGGSLVYTVARPGQIDFVISAQELLEQLKSLTVAVEAEEKAEEIVRRKKIQPLILTMIDEDGISIVGADITINGQDVGKIDEDGSVVINQPSILASIIRQGEFSVSAEIDGQPVKDAYIVFQTENNKIISEEVEEIVKGQTKINLSVKSLQAFTNMTFFEGLIRSIRSFFGNIWDTVKVFSQNFWRNIFDITGEENEKCPGCPEDQEPVFILSGISELDILNRNCTALPSPPCPPDFLCCDPVEEEEKMCCDEIKIGDLTNRHRISYTDCIEGLKSKAAKACGNGSCKPEDECGANEEETCAIKDSIAFDKVWVWSWDKSMPEEDRGHWLCSFEDKSSMCECRLREVAGPPLPPEPKPPLPPFTPPKPGLPFSCSKGWERGAFGLIDLQRTIVSGKAKPKHENWNTQLHCSEECKDFIMFGARQDCKEILCEDGERCGPASPPSSWEGLITGFLDWVGPYERVSTVWHIENENDDSLSRLTHKMFGALKVRRGTKLVRREETYYEWIMVCSCGLTTKVEGACGLCQKYVSRSCRQ